MRWQALQLPPQKTNTSIHSIGKMVQEHFTQNGKTKLFKETKTEPRHCCDRDTARLPWASYIDQPLGQPETPSTGSVSPTTWGQAADWGTTKCQSKWCHLALVPETSSKADGAKQSLLLCPSRDKQPFLKSYLPIQKLVTCFKKRPTTCQALMQNNRLIW